MTSQFRLRLLVSLLVLVTMGLFCQLCQFMYACGKSTSALAALFTVFLAFFGHVWMSIHSNALTRARKAFFDESNVLQTYQPRARTMGHLFCPEPPTPAPAPVPAPTIVKFKESEEMTNTRSEQENAAFNAMRDSHYANMFDYAMKMQKELQAMENAEHSSGGVTTQTSQSTAGSSGTKGSSTTAVESEGNIISDRKDMSI
ncbi:unnamed protein product [Thelazia callipaeda]|uniref:Transmembrane protein n=1 Tax=Thelazia callipaeda TaxID=103827 RepID=A0A0N5D0E6_THECL|nr:unnamed protein product [Thelazia callipaeda]